MHRQQFCRCFRFCAFEVSSSTPVIRVLNADAHVVEVAPTISRKISYSTSERLQGIKPLGLASVLKKRIQPAFRRIGITGVGWHTFRHAVGTMLAEMGEHHLTIRDYLRQSDLHVTSKHLQATSKTKRLAQDKLVDAILPTGTLPKTKPNPMNAS